MTRRIRHTKIVCTLGPSTSDPAVLEQLVEAGMNVARLNFSHGEHSEHAVMVQLLRELSAERQRPIAIIADLQGPKIRVAKLAGERVLIEGERVVLRGIGEGRPAADPDDIPVAFPDLVKVVSSGGTVLLADGSIRLRILDVDESGSRIECAVEHAGVLSSGKGVNIPGIGLDIPPLTPKDLADLEFVLAHEVDYIAQSFVRSADDVRFLREAIAGHDVAEPPQIIAKIEKREAVRALDEILVVSDAVMVARGDLGVELGAEQVPLVQKRIIRRANELSRPVITATQMLESMTNQPEPTRAEASDVANAILDGTDAVMLSGETAVGRYPVQTVRVMDRIARTVEPAKGIPDRYMDESTSIDLALSNAACDIAELLDAAAIVVTTASGRTARQVARNRPRRPIIAASHSRRVVSQLALDWGTVPMLIVEAEDTDHLWFQSLFAVKQSGLVQAGETVVFTAGSIMNVAGVTNMLKVETFQPDSIPQTVQSQLSTVTLGPIGGEAGPARG